MSRAFGRQVEWSSQRGWRVKQHVRVCVQPKRLAEPGGLEQPEGVAGEATRHSVCSTEAFGRCRWDGAARGGGG
jgi:hypothetical protein